jgi:ABC-type phosphate/phosphonate transport system substrate-binding protein
MTSKTSRRAVLAGAAALPALAVPAIAMTAFADPIFAAIDRHKTAYAEFVRVVRLEEKLHETIPAERRTRYHVEDRYNSEMIANEDPAWTKYQDAWFATNDAADERAIDLLNVAPTSIAGVAALLDYVATFEKNGEELFGSVAEEGTDKLLDGRIASMQWCADCLREISAAY